MNLEILLKVFSFLTLVSLLNMGDMKSLALDQPHFKMMMMGKIFAAFFSQLMITFTERYIQIIVNCRLTVNYFSKKISCMSNSDEKIFKPSRILELRCILLDSGPIN
jgi:hypothetical protein